MRALYTVTFATLMSGSAVAQVVIDGFFDDWAGIAAAATDPSGDVTGEGADLATLSFQSNDKALFVRFQLAAEILPPEYTGFDEGVGNDLRLYIDTDVDGEAGSQDAISFDADIEIQFAGRKVQLYETDGTVGLDFRYTSCGVFNAPSYTSDSFEIRIPYTFEDTSEAIGTFITGNRVRVWMYDDATGDRVPAEGAVTVELQTQAEESIQAIPFEKPATADFRLLTLNTSNSGPIFRQQTYMEFLTLIQPDIICWQEIGIGFEDDALDFVNQVLPSGVGESWHLAFQFDCVTLSRFPIIQSGAIDNNLVSLIDMPDSLTPRNLVLFNAHTPCCANNEARDGEHDRLAAAWRDILNDAGVLEAVPNDAMIMTGDFNMVGFQRQLAALRDGLLIDNVAHGEDFSPGWSAGSLEIVPYQQSHRPLTFTWFSSASTFFPGRLDWSFYTPDELQVRRSYMIFSPHLPPDVRDDAGLSQSASFDLSDHLPLVADFSFVTRATGSEDYFVIY